MRAYRPLALALLAASLTTRVSAVPCLDYSDLETPVQRTATPDFVFDLAYQDGHLYAAVDQAGLFVYEPNASGGFDEVGSVAIPGVSRSVATGAGHVFVGTDGVVHVIDTSDPSNPIVVGTVTFPSPHAINDVVVEGNLAYVATHLDGLQLVDISVPAAPVVVGSWTAPGNLRVRGVEIRDGLAYLATTYAGSTGKVDIVDVSNPGVPSIVGSVGVGLFSSRTRLVDDLLFVSAGGTGLVVVDVGNPALPAVASTLALPSGPWDLVIVGTRAYTAAGSGERVLWVDISNPMAPTLAGWVPEVGTHRCVIAVDGRIVCGSTTEIASFPAGAEFVSEPLVEIPSAEVYGLALDGTSLYLSTAEYGGSQVWDVTDPLAPVLASAGLAYGFAGSVAAGDGHAVVSGVTPHLGGDTPNIRSWDMSDIENPVALGFVSNVWPYALGVRGEAVYVLTSSSLEVRAAEGLGLLGEVVTQSDPAGFHVAGDRMFITGDGLEIFDLDTPVNPVSLGYLSLPTPTGSVLLEGTLAYVLGGSGQIYVIDVSDPTAPTLLGERVFGLSASDLAVRDGVLYAPIYGDWGVRIVDLSTGSATTVGILHSPLPARARSVAVGDGVVYVGTKESLLVFPPQCPLSVTGVPIVARGRVVAAPNPFIHETELSFEVPAWGRVHLDVVDVAGRRVATLLEESAAPGRRRVHWNGRGEDGGPVPAGVYFWRLRTADGAATGKVTRLR